MPVLSLSFGRFDMDDNDADAGRSPFLLDQQPIRVFSLQVSYFLTPPKQKYRAVIVLEFGRQGWLMAACHARESQPYSI